MLNVVGLVPRDQCALCTGCVCWMHKRAIVCYMHNVDRFKEQSHDTRRRLTRKESCSHLCLPAVRHAENHPGGAETHSVLRLSWPPDDERHREHHHQRGGEPEGELRELSDGVRRRWAEIHAHTNETWAITEECVVAAGEVRVIQEGQPPASPEAWGFIDLGLGGPSVCLHFTK